MVTIRNRKNLARAIDLRREYPEIGRTLYLRPNEIRVMPDAIADEEVLTMLADRGILTLTRPEPPEMKSERKPRRAAIEKSEREE